MKKPQENKCPTKKNEGFTSQQNEFSTFCQQTTLHGWTFIDSEGTVLRRFIWSLVMATACTVSVLSLILTSGQYQTAKTVTNIATTTASLGNIIFPSIFICNVNQVTKSFLVPLGASDNTDFANVLFRQFLSGDKGPKSQTDEAMLKNMTKILQSYYQWNETIALQKISSSNCSSTILFLEWDNTTQLLYNSYKTITDYGSCCVIVPYLDLVNEETINLDPSLYTGEMFHSIPRGVKNGISNGLKLVLDVDHFDYGYFPRGAKGFRIALSAPTDQAVINQDGFYISPGTEVLAALTPTVFNTTEEAISNFAPIDRNCYQDKELKLQYLRWEDGFRYSINNCFYEAVLLAIVQTCGCLPLFSKTNPYNLQLCTSQKLKCAENIAELFGNEKDPDYTSIVDEKNVTKKCLQRCDLQTESMMTTTSKFPTKETFPFRMEYCLILKKLSSVCSSFYQRQIFESKYEDITCDEITDNAICDESFSPNSSLVEANKKISNFLYRYAEENLSVVYIFIKDPYFTLISKDQKMSINSLIANAGGLLSLCMGLSFVSIFEVIYHFCNACFSKITRHTVMPSKG